MVKKIGIDPHRVEGVIDDRLKPEKDREIAVSRGAVDRDPVREKFRIRYYNDDLSRITLEKKAKQNGLCRKFSAPLSEEDCRAILSGEAPPPLEAESPLVRELLVKMKTELLRPRVLVSYTREPLVYPAGNVRVTFDSDIRTSLFTRRFLDRDIPDIPAADAPEKVILEVKYDAFLPEAIAALLQCGGIRVRAFSKYAAARRFG
ncbi:MAG: polyphosphate polymerase domain-containing protein [Bacteroides sp.]|nr:polyphosphate polymerase domain-containing protein [Eubacterium sp.]MCM1418038.1 polyphosphate polymerase domain-containing protein [Roseburia sp.]MCM1462139.1 polyphosphate polymerase domain-containing protein [Bacteroides sp.]